jgi:hypothetical protein
MKVLQIHQKETIWAKYYIEPEHYEKAMEAITKGESPSDLANRGWLHFMEHDLETSEELREGKTAKGSNAELLRDDGSMVDAVTLEEL